MEPAIFPSLEQRLNPGHTALIIIDMQNDYFLQESLVGQRSLLTEAINQLTSLARDQHCTIIWVIDGPSGVS